MGKVQTKQTIAPESSLRKRFGRGGAKTIISVFHNVKQIVAGTRAKQGVNDSVQSAKTTRQSDILKELMDRQRDQAIADKIMEIYNQEIDDIAFLVSARSKKGK